MFKTCVITGASSGIGLELVRLLKEDYIVWALCRKSTKELDELKVNTIEGVELTDEKVEEKLVEALKDTKIDLLINNAGVFINDELSDIKPSGLRAQFEINAIAPLRLTQALLFRLNPKAKLIYTSSRMGSMEDNSSGGHYGYRASKAALNAFAKSLSIDLKEKDIVVGVIHPGYVKTKS